MSRVRNSSAEVPSLPMVDFAEGIAGCRPHRASSKSDMGGVLQINNIHIAVAPAGDVAKTLAALKASPAGYADWLATEGAHLQHPTARHAVGEPRVGAALPADRSGHSDPASRTGLGRQGHRTAGDRPARGLPGHEGVSRANFMYMRAFADAWPDEVIVQQVVGQLPGGHNLVLLTKLKEPEQRLAYAQSAITNDAERPMSPRVPSPPYPSPMPVMALRPRQCPWHEADAGTRL